MVPHCHSGVRVESLCTFVCSNFNFLSNHRGVLQGLHYILLFLFGTFSFNQMKTCSL